ncbi:MAG: HD domain-containing protein, partial [Acidobacteria bacterium]|nr:HD domain-containing protein [Acidobacteriota bacterium]
ATKRRCLRFESAEPVAPGDKVSHDGRSVGEVVNAIGNDLLATWREFEDMQTPDAKFANAIDRFQPMMLNDNNDGDTWVERKITRSQVLERAEVIRDGCPALHEVVLCYIEKAVSRGHLKAD